MAAGLGRATPAGQPARLLTQTEQLVTMAENVETKAARGRVLQRLDLVALELAG